MAVFKIFPEKDATLYSAYPDTNTGLDQILEISNKPIYVGGNPEVSRVLIKFPQDTIQNVINTKVGISGSYQAFLKLFLANAETLPNDYTLYVNPISQSWESGIGRFLYNPADENGSSWFQRSNGFPWPSGAFAAGTTASFQPSNTGGGAWFTSVSSSQSFSVYETKDTEFPVTNLINSSSEGFIIRVEPGYEFNASSSFSLKYFSKDTHTIYLPQLEIRWDDSLYNTGSLVVLNDENINVTLGNNLGSYRRGSVYRMRVNARILFPRRQFLTQSVYLFNDALPSSSYWALQDLDTGDYVVDFDDTYTKVSCDPNGNYFDLYTDGLQPERYYKILIKSSFASGSLSTVIYDNNYTFKIYK